MDPYELVRGMVVDTGDLFEDGPTAVFIRFEYESHVPNGEMRREHFRFLLTASARVVTLSPDEIRKHVELIPKKLL
ncbi:MAG: hypothetical protein HY299_09795 [Verrucomicrobia bacterium]|nr:hypothetical protein [Verrucomicrobiota bacterium]